MLVDSLLECIHINLEVNCISGYDSQLSTCTGKEYVVLREEWCDCHKLIFRGCCECVSNRYQCRSASTCHEQLVSLCVYAKSLVEVVSDCLTYVLESGSHRITVKLD